MYLFVSCEEIVQRRCFDYGAVAVEIANLHY